MTNWREKYADSDRLESTPKTPESLSAPSRNVIHEFVRLVRIIGICERSLYLEDETILRELNADDLAELALVDRYDKQIWATFLAHRLCNERLQNRTRS